MLGISIVTTPQHGISTATMVSLSRYAREHLVQLSVGPKDVDWKSLTIGDFRKIACYKLNTEWACWLDSDDILINPFPNLELLRDYDALLFPTVTVLNQYKVEFRHNAPLGGSFTTRGVMKTPLMNKLLHEFVCSGRIREDVTLLQAVFKGALDGSMKVGYVPYPFVKKMPGRCSQSDEFKIRHTKECLSIYSKFFTKKILKAMSEYCIKHKVSDLAIPGNIYYPRRDLGDGIA